MTTIEEAFLDLSLVSLLKLIYL